MDTMTTQLKVDFEEFKDSCKGILLFGSHARSEQTGRSDIDICIVKPPKGIVNQINSKLGGKYDIKVFEKLPLYIKIIIIENNRIIYGDQLELSEYFYFFRKLWKDIKPRVMENEFKDFEERMKFRRSWVNERKKILREIGEI